MTKTELLKALESVPDDVEIGAYLDEYNGKIILYYPREEADNPNVIATF
jgi:hypothetical protein